MKTNMFDIGHHARWLLEGDKRISLLSENELDVALDSVKESVDFLRGMYGESVSLILDRINQDIAKMSRKYDLIQQNKAEENVQTH
jgi:hypothetical protein